MIKNKNLLQQLIWIIKEEKKFYDNYNSDNINNYINYVNYVNYIESLYLIIQHIK